MNYRVISILFIVFCFTNAFGQIEKDLVGFYQFRGGAHYLKADKTFIIIGYATIITGKWELKEKGIVLFTPDYEKQAFTLYGRHNKKLRDSAHIMVSYGLHDEETFMHIGTLDKKTPKLKRVFKEGHRCISFPYIIRKKMFIDTMSFSFLPYIGNRDDNYIPEVYTFYNTEKYNDFVALHHMVKNNDLPFTYLFKENKLYYDVDTYGEKSDNDKEVKEMELAIKETDGEPSGDAIYFTPLYNECNSVISQSNFSRNYKFDESKNAFINFLNYKEGEERQADYDFNNLNIINKYNRLTNFIQFKDNIKIDQVPIFKEYCNN